MCGVGVYAGKNHYELIEENAIAIPEYAEKV